MTADQVLCAVQTACGVLRLGRYHDREEYDREECEQAAAVAVLCAEEKIERSANPATYAVSVAINAIRGQWRRPGPATPGSVDRTMPHHARLDGTDCLCERTRELGDWWSASVREEVRRHAKDDWPVVARVWGLDGEPERPAKVAADLAVPASEVYRAVNVVTKRLRKSVKLRVLQGMTN